MCSENYYLAKLSGHAWKVPMEWYLCACRQDLLGNSRVRVEVV